MCAAHKNPKGSWTAHQPRIPITLSSCDSRPPHHCQHPIYRPQALTCMKRARSPLLYPPSTPGPVQPPRMSLVSSPALLGCESLETELSCCSFSPWQLASSRCSLCPNEWKIQFIFCLRGRKETFYISFPISFFWLHPDGKCNEMQKMEVMWHRVINASSGIP